MKLNLEDRKLYYFVVGFLLVSLFIALFVQAQQKSITVDEISHLASGYSKLKTADFRLNIEATPLIDIISALPLLLLNPNLPLNYSSWSLARDNEFQGQYHWEFGEQFFYNYGNDPDTILFYGRIPVMILSVLLGLLIFIFSRKLFGVKAGLFSLLLYVFNPTVLAHSSIATIDLGSAFFIFLAVYCFWKFVNGINIKNLIIAGLTFGLAQLSKFTALYLVFVYILLAFFYVIKKRKQGITIIQALQNRNSMVFYGLVFLIFLIGLITVVLGYFIIGFPKYIDGLRYVAFHSELGHPAYLLGERSRDGWWYYYLFAFLIKEPIPLLVLILLSLIFFKKIRHEDIVNEYFIAVPIVLLVITSFFTKINIGIRHILPIYPFLLVFVGRSVNLKINKQKLLAFVFGALALWYALEFVFIYPHTLAYFNEIIGGSKNGPKYLLDSNIDWGQDLKGLKVYLEKNSISEVRLGYWGKDRPEYRNIKYEQINCYPEPGIVAVSVNNLYGISEERAECLEWLRKYNPVDNIGYSILIYNISNQIDVKKSQEEFCVKSCTNLCSENKLKYLNSSFFNESCGCECG